MHGGHGDGSSGFFCLIWSTRTVPTDSTDFTQIKKAQKKESGEPLTYSV